MKYILPLIFLFSVSITLTAEDGHRSHHDEHDHEEEAKEHSTTSFKEGTGLTLSDEAIQTLAIETAHAQNQSFTELYKISALVFYAGRPTKANSIITLEIAERIKDVPQDGIKILGVKTEVYTALGLVEVLFEVPEEHKLGSKIPLKLKGATQQSIVIPRSALLQNTEGTFVYMASNDVFKRIPVSIGASNENYFEIKQGLAAGAEIVTHGVEQLWLTELRFTKGGGHGH